VVLAVLDEIPVEIADDERIVRAIMVPAHFDEKKKKLKKAAFRPAPGSDMLSVMRASYLTSDECKVRAKNAANQKACYVGFARILSGKVRECGSEVTDAREDYLGHAHISHGFGPLPIGEPLPPDVQAKFDERLNCLVSHTQFFSDADPDSETWKGEAF
jgi:hypothetical protein